MTIGIGYFTGGLALVAYSTFCFYVGLKRPEKLFRVAKLKFCKNKSDDLISRLCNLWAALMLIAGISVIIIGYIRG